ncbi:MAG: glycosyltransferase [Janthinobacterium lividum]
MTDSMTPVETRDWTDDTHSSFADTSKPFVRPDRAALYAIRLLFDRSFYLSHNQDVASTGIDPLDHFLTSGLAEGRSPCALFDPDFYLRQPGVPTERGFLFLHYLETGILGGLDPHPLVDASFYTQQSPALPAGTNPLTHMLGAGRRENRRPNPLFDPVYYRRRQPRADQTLHPLIHYVLRGWRERLQPHPLFDPLAYLELRPDIKAIGVDPLAHYLQQGFCEQARTHWLFDAEHYAANCPGQVAPCDALLHCASNDCGVERSPHPLFDPRHYMLQHPDLANTGIDPFLHFLEFGLAENRDPHPLFDTWFYRSQNPDAIESGLPPFVHYVRQGIKEGRDPNPFFPAVIYQVRNPDARHESAGPLAHFLRTPETHMLHLCDAFDPSYYRACNPSCAEAATTGMPPLSHYLSVGRAKCLSPVPRAIEQHNWILPTTTGSVLPSASIVGTTAILLIVQQASHSDAGLCALRALQQLVIDPDLSCRVVVRHDGPLAPAFAALAPTIILPADMDASADVDALADILHSFRTVSTQRLVIINSAAMPDVALRVSSLGIELLAWLHEMPLLIDSLLGGDSSMQTLARTASCIVTGSEAARDALILHYRLDPAQVTVIADGIAHPPPNLTVRQARLALRRQLGLPLDALVVMGSGDVAFRSGTDLFIRVAGQVISRSLSEAPADSALRQAFFLWIGATDDPLFAGLCQNDIDQLGLGAHVRLLNPDATLAEYLLGADMFLLTSRESASGIAGIEARTSGLPLVKFRFRGNEPTETWGGRDPKVSEVAYLDVDAMSDIVMKRGNRPSRRNRNSSEHANDGPSWETWRQGLRRLLADRFGIPAD